MIINITGSLGDEISLTAVVREFKKQFPKEIIFVFNQYRELFFNNPYVFSGIESNGSVFYLSLSPNNTIGNFVYAYAKILGIKIYDSQPELFLTDREKNMFEKGNTIAIDPWALAPTRRWKLDNFIHLVDLIHKYDSSIKVIEVGRKMEDCWGTWRKETLWNADESYVDKLTVRETASLLSSCRLYIGNDSGCAYLAASVNTPQIVLYSTAPWYSRTYRTTYPMFSLNRKCEGKETCNGWKCLYGDGSCLEDITAEDVIEVFKTINANN